LRRLLRRSRGVAHMVLNLPCSGRRRKGAVIRSTARTSPQSSRLAAATDASPSRERKRTDAAFWDSTAMR